MGVRVLVLLSALESRRANQPTDQLGDAEERAARDLGRGDGERGKEMEMNERIRDE